MNEESRTADWNKYWQGSQHAAAFASEGVNHPLVQEFWSSFFSQAADTYKQPVIIDLACGKGAVLEAAINAFGESGAHYECLDASVHAIDAVRSAHPGVIGHVADAGDPGLDRNRYDLAVSQFGVEYAGLKGIESAAQLVAPGGTLCLLIHHADGSIVSECERNLAATVALEETNLIQLAIAMFQAGYAALRGQQGVEAYNEATRAVIPAMRRIEELADHFGSDVAGGTVAQLYEEIANIQEDLRHYDDQEVLDWLNSMQSEMIAYKGRMQSMCDAAVSTGDFEAICQKLMQAGFDIVPADNLLDSGTPLAHTLIARKSGAPADGEQNGD